MGFDAAFRIPDKTSLFQAMVAAASIGWRSQVLVNSFPSGQVQYGLWLKHMTWHGSLCEVGWHTGFFPLRARTDIAAELELGHSLRSILPELMALWRDFPDKVPCFVQGRPEVNVSETMIFPDYLSGKRKVRYPERMNPVLDLPGWPGREDVEDYLNTEVIRSGGLDEALKDMSDRTAACAVRAYLSFDLRLVSYVGLHPAGATWNLMISQYPRKYISSLMEGQESGGSALDRMLLDGMQMIRGKQENEGFI